jgi:hypothetical protein
MAPRDVIDSDTDSDADPGKGSESKRENALDAFAPGLHPGGLAFGPEVGY